MSDYPNDYQGRAEAARAESDRNIAANKQADLFNKENSGGKTGCVVLLMATSITIISALYSTYYFLS